MVLSITKTNKQTNIIIHVCVLAHKILIHSANLSICVFHVTDVSEFIKEMLYKTYFKSNIITMFYNITKKLYIGIGINIFYKCTFVRYIFKFLMSYAVHNTREETFKRV